MLYLQWLLNAMRCGGIYGCDGADNNYGSGYSDGSGDTYDGNYAEQSYGYFNSAGYGCGDAYGDFIHKKTSSGGYGGGDGYGDGDGDGGGDGYVTNK